MTSTSAVACPPPPTINKLDPSQRARVMRSSRKLGAVLGTTPFFLESCGSTMPATLHYTSKLNDVHPHVLLSHVKHHYRQCSVLDEARTSSESLPVVSLSRASSSSKESLLSSSDSSAEDVTIPLVLAPKIHYPSDHSRPVILVNSVPLSSTDPRVQVTPLSQLSPSTDVPPTPITPIEPSRTEVRRRKMARVVRTLGENVPPELVFRPSDSDWAEKSPVPTTMVLESRSAPRMRSNPRTDHRRRSASVGSSTKWQRLLELPAPVFSSGSKAPEDQRWVGEWNRRNISQVQCELRALRR